MFVLYKYTFLIFNTLFIHYKNISIKIVTKIVYDSNINELTNK